MIEDQEVGCGLVGERFSQLLHDPCTRGMSGDIEVQDAAGVVTDDEEAIEQAKIQGGDGEEIHRRDGVSVIAQKSQPAFRRFRIPGGAPHPAGNRCL